MDWAAPACVFVCINILYKQEEHHELQDNSHKGLFHIKQDIKLNF